MDSEPKAKDTGSDLAEPRAGTASDSGRRVATWSVAMLAIMTMMAFLLAVALLVVVRSDDDTSVAAPPARTVTSSGTGDAADRSLAPPFTAATFRAATPRMVEHVDGAIAAYNSGAPIEHIMMGGHGSNSFSQPTMYRYEPGDRTMVKVSEMRAAIGAPGVERTGPVVVISEDRTADSWTVAFAVRAGGRRELWLQRWEDSWGECLMQMWVM